MTDFLRCGGGRLRRYGVLLLLAAMPALGLAACSPVKPFVPDPSQIPHGQGRLWQVDGPGLETSYVFATFDGLDKRALDLPPAVTEAFGKTEALVLEGVGDQYLKAEIYTEENLELSGDQTLDDLIGARSFGTLSWHMKQRQRLPNPKAKPWVMWVYLGGENFGFGEYKDYEYRTYEFQVTRLRSRADEGGMEIEGLMTEQEYFDIYDKIPLDQQADMLKVTLDRYEGLPPQTTKGRFYLDGDLARLDAVWREYLSWLQPETAATLDARRITDRNGVMVDRLLPLMQEKSIFVALDSLHLPGEMGILRLLEQRGLTVARLL
ncbi:TraB/GumN family protein [Pelagibius sp. 7325]|uniref:TraB/GumN family protein n=1 Tax=Pelagibius sp. 7325 TaxID=3131994 RepID=UPI0030EE52F2